MNDEFLAELDKIISATIKERIASSNPMGYVVLTERLETISAIKDIYINAKKKENMPHVKGTNMAN